MVGATPWLSIVTVLKDDLPGLRQTLHSFTDQNLRGVEWIIVDSSSNPSEVPQALTRFLPQPKIFWTPPAGVFPAMNLGLQNSSGQFVYFLNAGDELLPGALDTMGEVVSTLNPTWVVAPVRLHEMSGSITTTPILDFSAESESFFSRGQFANHQGTIVQADLLRDLGGFAETYEVAADYEIFLRLTEICPPVQIETPVARFTEGGVSTQHWLLGWMEFGRARQTVFQLKGRDRWKERWRSIFNLSAMSWHRSPWPVAVLLTTMALLFLLLTGVSFRNALVVTGAVVTQSVAGALWWRMVRRGSPVSLLELLGMGLALGTTASMLIGLWLPWWLAPLVLIAGWFWFRRHTTISPLGRLTRAGSIGLAAGLIPGLLGLFYSIRNYPLSWIGTWSSYHGDIPFFEALAASVAKFGPGPSIFMEGASLRYHSLVYGWAGQLTVSLNLEPFVVLVRVLPVVVLIGSVLLATAWASRLSPGRLAPILAALLIVTGGFVGATFGTVLNFDSPSQAMTTMWLLGFSLATVYAMSENNWLAFAAPLAVISIGLSGGKISSAAIAVAGVGFLSVVGLARQTSWRWRAVGVFLTSSLTTTLVFFLLLSGSREAGGLQVFSLLDRASSLQSLNPVVTERGIVAGIFLLMLAVLPRWLGLAWLATSPSQRWTPDTVLGYGYAFSALGTILVLSGGFNDLWFAVAASAPLAVLSAVGVAQGWEWLSSVSLVRAIAAVLLGAGSALTATIAWASGSSGIIGIGWRWFAPLAALLIVAFVGLTLGLTTTRHRARTALAVVIIACVLASLPSRFSYSIAGRFEKTFPTSTSTVLFSPPEASSPWRGSDRLGWSDSEASAGAWLREASSSRDLVSTNLTNTAIVAALTRLPTYISAARLQSAYGRDQDYSQIADRENISWEFIDNPTQKPAFDLCEADVRWIWVDPRLTSTETWEPFASVRFASDDVVILEFNSESCNG